MRNERRLGSHELISDVAPFVFSELLGLCVERAATCFYCTLKSTNKPYDTWMKGPRYCENMKTAMHFLHSFEERE